MAKTSMKKIAKIMRKLDICMFNTQTARGMLGSRPMSNNRDVDYNGDSYFFTDGDSRLVGDLKKNKHVSLAFNGKKAFHKVYVSVSGVANLVKSRAEMEEHWNKDLEIWFKDGLDTPGITMIKVHARHIKMWDGMEESELSLN